MSIVVRNKKQLEAALLKQLNRAMNEAYDEMYERAEYNVADFYSQGDPKEYERTGALGETPRITPMAIDNNSVEFHVFLDDEGHKYTTGTFTMSEVLNAAETQTAGILGKPHFWERTEDDIKEILDKKIDKYF